MPGEHDHDLARRVRSVLEERPEVVFAYLFGSRAEGGTHGASDVDVAVYLSEESDDGEAPGSRAGGDAETARERDSGRALKGRLEAWSEIHGDLVDALAPVAPDVGMRSRGHAPEGVDLVILNDAPPLLADRVIRGGELLFSRSEPERIRWIVRQKSRYCDLRPLRRRLDATLSERLRSGRFGRRGTDESDGSGR